MGRSAHLLIDLELWQVHGLPHRQRALQHGASQDGPLSLDGEAVVDVQQELVVRHGLCGDREHDADMMRTGAEDGPRAIRGLRCAREGNAPPPTPEGSPPRTRGGGRGGGRGGAGGRAAPHVHKGGAGGEGGAGRGAGQPPTRTRGGGRGGAGGRAAPHVHKGGAGGRAGRGGGQGSPPRAQGGGRGGGRGGAGGRAAPHAHEGGAGGEGSAGRPGVDARSGFADGPLWPSENPKRP